MKNVTVTISGVTPLICNRFTDEAAEKASSGKGKAMAAGCEGTPLEVAEKKLYTGTSGEHIIPQPNILKCIVEGGKFHKAGKKQITTQKESLLYACADIQDIEIKIQHKQPWKVHTAPIVNPATGGRRNCHRPMFDDWKLTFTLTYDETFINEKLIRQIVDDAGLRIGLGDWRPARKGPYGKFRVDKWEAKD